MQKETPQEISDSVREFVRSEEYRRLEAFLFFKQEGIAFSERCLSGFAKSLHAAGRKLRAILDSLSLCERLEFVREFKQKSPVFFYVLLGRKA